MDSRFQRLSLGNPETASGRVSGGQQQVYYVPNLKLLQQQQQQQRPQRSQDAQVLHVAADASGNVYANLPSSLPASSRLRPPPAVVSAGSGGGGSSGQKMPAIPRSQVVKTVMEPSYSTILQPSEGPVAATAVATAVPAEDELSSVNLGSSGSGGSSSYNAYFRVSGGPPSPVSSSYSELQQVTQGVYGVGRHLQHLHHHHHQPHHVVHHRGHPVRPQHNYQQQQQQQAEPLYEPVTAAPQGLIRSSKAGVVIVAPQTHRLRGPGVVVPQPQVREVQGGLLLTPNRQQDWFHHQVSSPPVEDAFVAGPSSSDYFGDCSKCSRGIVGEGTGCTAMGRLYHIACFTCTNCQCFLQGKPFYALDGKPYCEADYLQTLEKCCKCFKPILDRILRATGKPYHPQCFTCVVCAKSLDGVPFTVDATNQIHCIEDFHRRFAPRCSVCRQPIMPEPGNEETVRVVALDRSFHVSCYKCEDCGLLLSSESEGRGCYPLDDHVLCKQCNTKRIQLLTQSIR